MEKGAPCIFTTRLKTFTAVRELSGPRSLSVQDLHLRQNTTIALIFYALKADHDYLLLYLAMIAVVALAVKITRASFGAAGKWVSKQFLGHLGDPLKKKTSVRACSPFEPHHHHSCNLLLCRVVEKMARPELAIGHSQLHGTDGI